MTRRNYPAPRLLTLPMIHGRCEEVGECLIWTQSASGSGTPYAQHGGKVTNMRRLVYELSEGEPLPADRVVRMCCGSTLCLQREHMKASTRGQLIRDMARQGKLSSPSASASKLVAARKRAAERNGMNMERANKIRAETGTLAEIAARNGMHKSTVSTIRRGATWRETGVAGSSVFSQGGG